MGILIGVAVGFVMGAKSGTASLGTLRSVVTGLASSGEVSKMMSGAMPMAGQLLKSGRGALEGLRKA